MTLPVLASSLPSAASPKLENQTDPSLGDDHVMRLHGLPRQVVFGDDRVRIAPGRPWESLELIIPGFALAQINRAHVVGEALLGRQHPIRRIRWPDAHGRAKLRLERRALARIGAHALDHLHEALGVVARLHDALERVADDAAHQPDLLLVGAGKARHPFRIGELGGDVVGLAQLDVGIRRAAGRDLHRFRPV